MLGIGGKVYRYTATRLQGGLVPPLMHLGKWGIVIRRRRFRIARASSYSEE